MLTHRICPSKSVVQLKSKLACSIDNLFHVATCTAEITLCTKRVWLIENSYKKLLEDRFAKVIHYITTHFKMDTIGEVRGVLNSGA